MSLRKPLGKGIKALIPDHIESAKFGEKSLLKIESLQVGEQHRQNSMNAFIELSISNIQPNKLQPRDFFDDEKIKELTESIKANGVMQPVVVQEKGGGYELIAGERRLRAAKAAGLSTIPAVVKNVTYSESLELALIENIQRENLSAVEEGRAYKRLIDEFGLTQEEVSRKVGKERSTITNAMRLLKLPLSIQDDVSAGLLTMGHARAILSLASDEEQLAVRELIVKKGLSVRAVESLINSKRKTPKKVEIQTQKDEANLLDIQNKLQKRLGAKTKINRQKDKGVVEIYFYSDENLESIVEKILGE
jgi:ParB family chromosome partitioning protein